MQNQDLTQTSAEVLRKCLEASPNNALDVLKSQNKSLAFIKAVNGETTIKALLTTLIYQVLDYFKTEPMSERQIVQTVQLIITDPGFLLLKPDDYILCFNRAKKGFYGKLYNRIDGQVIFEWLNNYILERDQEIEDLRIRESQQEKADSKVLPDIFQGFKVTTSEPKEKTVIERNISHQDLMKEFDKLYDEQGSRDGAIRFVEFGGRNLTLPEYVEARLIKGK